MPTTRLFLTAGTAALLVSTAAAQGPVTQNFQAQRLQVDALIAGFRVDVVPGTSGIQVSVDGEPEMVQKLRLSTSGDALVIGMEGIDAGWWDDMWGSSSIDPEDLHVVVTLSPGIPIKVDNYMGDAQIGDIKAPIRFNTSGGDTRIGEVTDAKVTIAGSGDINVFKATGTLEASIAGSGSINGGNVGEANLEIAGGGDITLGRVERGLDIDIAGSGEVRAEAVNGKLDIDVAGSGDVTIDGGTADPFKVDIAGSGSVRFGGTANNPDVSVMGSGDVWIAAYTGTLSSDGADIKIGKAE
ncbi:hypothetical protein sos41_02230 [Alphaproteobacteria bacterium SO-S41]|nr:hypothetical protein sos41_02230 [Alphaproteobacteria bacterium SO-S41]